MCEHSGTYSGASRYVRDAGELRLVLLCDQCGAECRELERVPYRPDGRLPGRKSAAVPAGGVVLDAPAAPIH